MSAPVRSASEKRAFAAAWIGWAFDGLDGHLYVLVALPFVAGLLARAPSDPEVASRAAVIQAVFLVGWALGGILFGRLGDRIGRARALSLSILVFAVFTGLTAGATAWWHLMILRFAAALGIGGEWAAGAALVSESLRSRHRLWAGAALQSGYMAGMIAAAGVLAALGDAEPRWVFLVGAVPALAAAWCRRNVPEPAAWIAASAEALPETAALFRPPLRRRTLLMLGLTSAMLTAAWALLYFGLQAARAAPGLAAGSREAGDDLVAKLTLVVALAAIAGNFACAACARAFGCRRAILAMLGGATLCLLAGFHAPLRADAAPLVMGAAAFFAIGAFGVFPIYLPMLFPTLLRTLGAGLCYNTGRLVAAAGVFAGGTLAAQAGGAHRVVWWAGFLLLPAMAATLFIPELEVQGPAAPGAPALAAGEPAAPRLR